MTERTAIKRALEGYDPEFCAALSNKITETIGLASFVADAPLMMIRTGETTDALVSCLISILALSPEAHSPARLRKLSNEIAKRIRSGVTAAKDDPSIAQLLAFKPNNTVHQ
jgi:hypothetical protein